MSKPCVCIWFLGDQEVQAVSCRSLYSILWQRRSVSMMLSVVILAFVWKRSMQYIIEPFLARGTKNHKGRCGYLEGIQWKRSIMKWSRTWSRYIDMLPRLRELAMPPDDSEKGTAFCFKWKWRIGEKSCLCLPLGYKACQSCTEVAECSVMFLGALWSLVGAVGSWAVQTLGYQLVHSWQKWTSWNLRLWYDPAVCVRGKFW